ncbi:MAG: superoxide dismutase family protein [Gemmatimonadaceae bacterium]
MRNTCIVALGAIALVSAGACKSAPVTNDGSIHAVAYLLDSLGKEDGIVRLTESPGMNGVLVQISVKQGATPGQHGFHFHSVGSCAPANKFAAAGGHFNPAGKKHGLFAADGPHAGDHEALTVDEFRHASYENVDRLITLSPGPNSLLDADGSSIVLHAHPDDQRTDPSGDTGERIACGVIVRLP